MACALVAPLVGLRSQSALAAYASATFTINLTPTISNGFASADAVGLDVPDARGDQHGSATHYETRAHTSWGNGVVTIGEFYANASSSPWGDAWSVSKGTFKHMNIANTTASEITVPLAITWTYDLFTGVPFTGDMANADYGFNIYRDGNYLYSDGDHCAGFCHHFDDRRIDIDLTIPARTMTTIEVLGPYSDAYVSTPAQPEPSSVLMMLVGAAMVLRRHREDVR
jgi:hypothetical protein